MNIVGIIQARMGSTRLPGKVLREINGESLLVHIVRRARHAKTLNAIVVATTLEQADDEIVEEANRIKVSVFRGDACDVLDRYYHAACEHRADIVVRLTADCPLLDPTVVDLAVNRFRSNPPVDYVVTGSTYPEGYGVEVFGVRVLEVAWREANLASEREHVTPYIWKRPDCFKLAKLEIEEDLSRFRVTVDEESDLSVVCNLMQALAPSEPLFGLQAVASYLKAHPEIATINNSIPRQAGYWKSVEEDRHVSKPRNS